MNVFLKKPNLCLCSTLKEFLKSWWEMLREKILTPDQKFPFTSVFQCCTLDTECALSNKPLCLFEFSYGKISKLRCTNIIKDKSKIKWNTYMLSLHCPQQYFFMNWWEWLQYLIKCCLFFLETLSSALSIKMLKEQFCPWTAFMQTGWL